jgi:hypothetical protein
VSFDDDIFEAQRDEMNPGYLVAPGGWSTPADVIPQLLTPVRGGMKYPARKEEPVAARTYTNAERRKNAQEARKRNEVKATTADIRAELESLDGLAAKLVERRMQLEQALATSKPTEPGPGHDRYSVQVQFAPRGKKYEFLLLRSGYRWYTTGTSEKTAVFYSWDQLVDWLTGPDVHWYSELRVLTKSGLAYSFGMGKVVDIDGGEPPF